MILGLFTLLGTAALAQETPTAQEPTPPQPSLLIQSWVTAWDQDQRKQSDPSGYGDPEDDPGFKLRRVRAGFMGEDGALHYGILFGMSSPADGVIGGDGELEVVDAYGGWAIHRHLGVTAGVQKVPFGREALISAADLVFQERSVASNHLTPGRELGVVASVGPEHIDLTLGAFNGNGSLLGDDNAGFLLAARAQYDLGLGEGGALSVGLNGLYDSGLATEELGLGVDFQLELGSLEVLAEGIALSLEPTHTDLSTPAVLGKTQRLGGHLQVGYTIQQWEPAVRIEFFDDDRDAEDNGDLLHALVGLTGHFADDRVRAGAGVLHREELQGKALANDTARIWLQINY